MPVTDHKTKCIAPQPFISTEKTVQQRRGVAVKAAAGQRALVLRFFPSPTSTSRPGKSKLEASGGEATEDVYWECCAHDGVVPLIDLRTFLRTGFRKARPPSPAFALEARICDVRLKPPMPWRTNVVDKNRTVPRPPRSIDRHPCRCGQSKRQPPPTRTQTRTRASQVQASTRRMNSPPPSSKKHGKNEKIVDARKARSRT